MRWPAIAAVTLVLGGCGRDGSGGPAPAGSPAPSPTDTALPTVPPASPTPTTPPSRVAENCLTFTPAFLELTPGASGSLRVDVDRADCPGDVALQVIDLPAGVVASTSLTVSAAADGIDVPFHAVADATPGTPVYVTVQADATSWAWSVRVPMAVGPEPEETFPDPVWLPPDVFASSALPYDDGVLLYGDELLSAGREPDLRPIVGKLDASGVPDPSFGRAGWSDVPFPTSARVLGAAVDASDGVLVGFGEATNGWLARLQPDGSLDPGFGAGGVEPLPDAATVTAFVGDGSGGALVSTWNGAEGRVLRVGADGALDVVLSALPEYGFALAEPDGAILWIEVSSTYGHAGVVARRFRRSGAVDEGYGSGGSAVLLDCSDRDMSFGGAAVDGDGRLLFSAKCWENDAHGPIPIRRVLTSGAADASFHAIVYPIWYSDSWPLPFVFEDDGSMWLASDVTRYSYDDVDQVDMALQGLRPDGSNASVGTNGLIDLNVGWDDWSFSLARTRSGRLVETGGGERAEGRPYQEVLVCARGCD